MPALEHVTRTGPAPVFRYAPDAACERLGPGDADGAFESPGGGRVFTAPVTDWPHALVGLVGYTDYRAALPRVAPPCAQVRTITLNVLRELGGVMARR